MERRCMKCRGCFEPETRFVFRCNNCKSNQENERISDEQYMGGRYADPVGARKAS